MKDSTRIILEDALIDLGVSPSDKSFKYIIRAIETYDAADDMFNIKVRDIYEKIAAESNNTLNGVTKVFRRAMVSIYQNNDKDKVYRLMGNDSATNKALSTLTLKLKRFEEATKQLVIDKPLNLDDEKIKWVTGKSIGPSGSYYGNYGSVTVSKDDIENGKEIY